MTVCEVHEGFYCEMNESGKTHYCLDSLCLLVSVTITMLCGVEKHQVVVVFWEGDLCSIPP